MQLLIYGINAYLTYYTFSYARKIWRDGNMAGAIATGVIALSFLPLTFIIFYVK